MFIAGSTGFLGANITRHFLDKGYEIHSLVRDRSNLWRIKSVRNEINLHFGNLLARKKLSDVLNKIKPNIIINASGVVSGFSLLDQRNIMTSNFETTLNLVNACINVNFDVFINTSTAYEYGERNNLVTERMRTAPVNLYGITKVASTSYSKLVAQKYSKPIITCRIFTPYGYYDSPQRVIPHVIFELLNSRQPDLKRPDSKRDFIFVSDVCRAYESIMQFVTEIRPGSIFNIGTGKCLTVREVVEIISKIINRKFILSNNLGEQDMMGIENLCSDCTKIKRETGWRSETDIKEGLTRTIKWFQDNLRLYSSTHSKE